MPTAIAIFVGNASRLTGDTLLARGLFRCPVSFRVSRKGLREHAVDAIGPSAIVLDNLIDDLGHDAHSSLQTALINTRSRTAVRVKLGSAISRSEKVERLAADAGRKMLRNPPRRQVNDVDTAIA